jgi:integrase
VSAVEARTPRRAPAEFDRDLSKLREILDIAALIDAGWDPARSVFTPSPEHPVFGFDECVVNGCVGIAVHSGAVCTACHARWRRVHKGLAFEEFVRIQRPRLEGRRKREVLCRVCRIPGFERPAYGRSGLCMQCRGSFEASGVGSVDEWIAGGQPRGGMWKTPRPPARPRPSLGWCARCGYRASYPAPVSCLSCRHYWKLAGRPDWETWCREHPLRAATNPRILVLAGVPERVRLELLVGVQDAMRGERRFNEWGGLTRAAAALSQIGARSVLDVEDCPIRSDGTSMLFARVQWSVRQALADPAAVLTCDVWELGLLRHDGGRSTLDPRQITQPWLREIYRDWARQALGEARHIQYLRSILSQVLQLSESLRTRPDGGDDPAAVSRRDIENFLMRLAGMAAVGEIANSSHVNCVTMNRALLRRARERGLTAPGARLHGLAETFAFYENDVPDSEERDPDDEIGRSLPNAVIKQLVAPDALGLLIETSGQEVADIVELLIRTGRRPAEICHVSAGCLQWDERAREDGRIDRQPVLVYRPEKTPKRAKRLPVHAREAQIITNAAARARARFPDVAGEKLPLFPRRTQNLSGTVPIDSQLIKVAVRAWMRRLPELADSDGSVYDRARVFPYAFRHSYAQRLADSGCPAHLLMDLMDHRAFATTMAYCRIRQQRRRDAVELEQRWQWDAEGNELTQIVERFAESEDIRARLGSVAIPYGSCVEPSNVAALGSACPYRMRCIGCKHFRTDLTHLAALEKYLTDLLAARERILAATDELADWAKRDALPSDEQIDRVRSLIRRMRQKIDTSQPRTPSRFDGSSPARPGTGAPLTISPPPLRS